VLSLSANELETLNRLVLLSRLLPNAVHESNNELQVVAGSGELIELRPDAVDRVRDRARKIALHSRRASEMLAHVIGFWREDRALRGIFDVRDTAEAVLAMRRYSIGKLRIQADLDAPRLCPAFGNRMLTAQILLNLVIGAEDALAGQPNPRLLIRLRTQGASVTATVGHSGAPLAETDDLALSYVTSTLQPHALAVFPLGWVVAEQLAEQQKGLLRADEPAGTLSSVATLVLPAPEPAPHHLEPLRRGD